MNPAGVESELRRLLSALDPADAALLVQRLAGEFAVDPLAMPALSVANRSVLGLDGCKAGWVVAVIPASGDPTISFLVIPDITWLTEQLSNDDVAAVGIDIPIGLPDGGPRACDLAARRALGARRSSVFPAPSRPLLAAESYWEANQQSRTLFGKGLSQQAFAIVSKVRQVDEFVTPEMQRRVVEVHPEVSFAVASGRPMQHHKATPEGREERLLVLEEEFSSVRVACTQRPQGTQPDDLIDAAIAAWSARRHLDGVATRLGGDVDGRGLVMEIVA